MLASRLGTAKSETRARSAKTWAAHLCRLSRLMSSSSASCTDSKVRAHLERPKRFRFRRARLSLSSDPLSTSCRARLGGPRSLLPQTGYHLDR